MNLALAWGWLKSNAIIIAVAAVLVIVAYVMGRSDGKHAVWNKQLKANIEALETKGKADAAAADERLSDQSRLTNAEKERTDAIDKADPAQPGAARRALNCQRLRAAGKGADADAAGCGPARGN